MRKMIINTFLSLDGVMQAPGGPEEDPTGGFVHGGWSVNYWDEMMMKIMDESMPESFDLLLGRKTYEIFAAHWPFVQNDPDVLNQMAADKLNNARKYVVSKTLPRAEWQNSILIKDDVVNEIAKLKKQDGPEIHIHGSSNLIQTLLKNDLADEIRMWVFPVVLGRGKRLFGGGALSTAWKLTDSKTSSTGVIIAFYRRDGEIQKGSAALETPTKAELARREKMNEEQTSELLGIARLKIHHGKLEEFKRLQAECIESVRTRDTGTLQYDLFFNGDHTECLAVERYRDSEALLEHFANLGNTMAAIFETCSGSGEICGTPSQELMKALESSPVCIFSPYQSK